MERTHPASGIRYGLLQEILRATRDPDQELGSWMEFGAPMGIMRPIRPGGHFPLAESPGILRPADLASGAFRFTSNHPSFEDN